MAIYVVRRLLGGLVLLFVVLTVVFVLLRVAPGDPVRSTLGETATAEEVARQRAALGLDQPIWVQYVTFLGQILRFDLGDSIRIGDPVWGLIAERLPATLELSLAATIVAVVVGVGLGVIAAANRGTWIDQAASGFGLFGISAPPFWLGLILVLYLGNATGWFPTGGRLPRGTIPDGPTGFLVLDGILAADLAGALTALQYLTLPAITLGASMAGILVRITRSAMLDVLNEDYIRTALSKGTSRSRVVLRHGLRTALMPIVTIFGLEVAGLLSGAVLVETVFSWPGLGSLTIEAVTSRDYALVQGCAVVFAVIFVLANLLVDISYSFIDPRIRY